MTKDQYYNLKWKLPDLLYGYIQQGQRKRLHTSLHVMSYNLIDILSGEKFPEDWQLKSFCEEFKLNYNKIKTWNVTHIDEDKLS